MPLEGYETLYEPFIGGGAVFLSLCPEKAVINDINQEFINLYQTVKREPEEILAAIDCIDDGIPEDDDEANAYYAMRSRYNELIATQAREGEWERAAGIEERHAFNRAWLAACCRVLGLDEDGSGQNKS